jgi:ribonuclease P protein component
MIPRRTKLSRQDLAGFRPKTRVESPHFSVSLGSEEGPKGFAIVVSKKVARLSVSRHLLKRRIASMLRELPPFDRAVVVYAKAGSPALPFANAKKELLDLIHGKM